MVPFESFGTVSYSPSIVIMALSCTSSEIKPDIGNKSWFFHTPLHSAPLLGGPRRNIAIPFGIEKLEWRGYPIAKNIKDMYNRLHTILACDGETDRQTSCRGIVRAMYTRRAVKTRQLSIVHNYRTLRHVMTKSDVSYEVYTLHFHFMGEYSKLDRVKTMGTHEKINAIWWKLR